MHPLLTSLGLPDLLEDPESLSKLTDEQLDLLANVRDEAADALDLEPDNEENIDAVYLSHMTLTSALFLRALTADVQAQALPPGSVLLRSWNGSPLRIASKEHTAEMVVPTATLDVLNNAGLPAVAEPELTFDEHPVRLLSLMDLPSGDDEDTSDEFFSSFWRIAFNSYEDAICIDERADGIVVMLDKEWGYYAQQFVNSSVGHFLLCLEAWRVMEVDAGDDVDTIIETFERSIERIDPAALTEGAFGSDCLDALDDSDEEDEA